MIVPMHDHEIVTKKRRIGSLSFRRHQEVDRATQITSDTMRLNLMATDDLCVPRLGPIGKR
eukprot:Ihof_evm2s156 gene=Ihof_evmTU2s156